MAEPEQAPYKFLDSYGEGDAHLFFGRERETEILLADILLSRLVVLFARTGTGKTSLINAAVRPELERRGFETFFVRVQRDPAASAREALRRHARISRLPRTSLADQLERVVERLGRPIVVFFDQFEEFFLYQLRDDPAGARSFVADLGALSRRAGAGVHVVLSMREDFYVELDAFRDEIPTIFHRDSNLRLRWFEEQQARDAIVRPALAQRVEVEPRLVDRLVEDLSRRHGLVEPAQLQIVCDTLWDRREDGRIRLERYLELGAEDGQATIAEQIVNSRLARQFEAFDRREELVLLERLLTPGVLTTERGTKYPRDLPGLARELEDVLLPLGGDGALGAIVRRLEAARLVRLYVRDELEHVELMHDYLATDADRLADLRRSVRDIWPRRILRRGVGAWDEEREAFALQTVELEEVLRRAAAEWRREQDEGRSPEHLPLAADEALVLLHLALHRGLHAREAFELAAARGLPAREVVSRKLRGRHVDDAVNAVALLGELATDEAVDLLRRALAREDVAREAVAALAQAQAVEALAEALGVEPLQRDAQDALEALARSARDAGVRAGATRALVEHLRGELRDPVRSTFAVEDLGRIDAEPAVAALEDALRDDELAEDAAGALQRLAGSSRPGVAERARRALAASGHGAAGREAAPPPPPPVKRRPDPAALETHYRLVAGSLLEGRVVLVLGGAVAAERAARERLRGRRARRDGGAVDAAARLADTLAVPLDGGGLPQVAQAFVALRGEAALYEELGRIHGGERAPTPVHAFVASLASLRRRLGALGSQLVVTTAYDDTLERAFAERGEPFDVVYYDRRADDFLVVEAEGAVDLFEPAAFLSGVRPTILKPCGDLARRSGLVVTEDDFAALGKVRAPAAVPAAFRESHVLFLGYGIGDWSARALLDTLTAGGAPRSLRSWAIAREHDELEAHLWEARSVEALALDPGTYVVELERHLHDEAGQVEPRTVEAYHEQAGEYEDPATRVAALLQLAELHHAREEYREEVEVCTQALALAPDDPDVLYQRAAANWYGAWYAEAVADFDRVLELVPGWPEAHSGRGQALAEWGEFQRALPDLDRAIKKASGEVVAYARSSKGLALGGLGRFPQALKELERSLRAEPENAWAYFNRALTYERMGEEKRALLDFRRALDMSNPPLNRPKREQALARVPGGA